ncbi:membrane protein [Photobacterium aquae]|uniref:Membrane protein n=1 Tax=Photobacterium aquae TaxID=1195763 RepID=A0A0J1HCH8_9GAMM|nr:membrane protein [Photobacterium aquae]
MALLEHFGLTFIATVRDVAPIASIILVFQLAVLRKPIGNWPKVLLGFVYVIIGLALFLMGLELALFPIGEAMASQLTSLTFLYDSGEVIPATIPWNEYYWVYLFAAAIGFSTTIAEPSLIAVALKANRVSGGSIGVNGLRIAVALGVAMGIALGSYRIVVGDPLHNYILLGYVVVVIQTNFAPKSIVPLAYDSGGVTTSTVTVPIVTALGLGLASTVPGRNPMLDGFGLIAFASLFPMITVMAYAQLAAWQAKRRESDAL